MTTRVLAPAWRIIDPDTFALDWPDGSGEQYPAALLFSGPSDRQILHNLQLTAEICGIPDPTADPLRRVINLERGGLKTAAGRVYLGPITTDGDTYRLTYGPTTDTTDYGIEFSVDDWLNRRTSPLDVIANAAGRLAAVGIRRLDAAALVELNAHTWRGF